MILESIVMKTLLEFFVFLHDLKSRPGSLCQTNTRVNLIILSFGGFSVDISEFIQRDSHRNVILLSHLFFFSTLIENFLQTFFTGPVCFCFSSSNLLIRPWGSPALRPARVGNLSVMFHLLKIVRLPSLAAPAHSEG